MMISAQIRLNVNGTKYTAHIYPGEDNSTMHVYNDRAECVLTTFAPSMVGYAKDVATTIADEIEG